MIEKSKKNLPTVSAPVMVMTLPISGQKIKYRPFIIKEQKALLLAQESKDSDTVLETIKAVIHSCTNGTLEFTKVPTADLAYFFIQLRIASVGPEIKFSIPCSSCGADNIINMSLTDVHLDSTGVKTEIKISDDVGIKFKLPTIDDALDVGGTDSKSIKLLYSLIEYIYDADSVYQKDDYTEEEFRDWIESLNDSQVGRIKEFVDSIPTLKHTLNFNCGTCNAEQSRLLEGLHNFFRFNPNS